MHAVRVRKVTVAYLNIMLNSFSASSVTPVVFLGGDGQMISQCGHSSTPRIHKKLDIILRGLQICR